MLVPAPLNHLNMLEALSGLDCILFLMLTKLAPCMLFLKTWYRLQCGRTSSAISHASAGCRVLQEHRTSLACRSGDAPQALRLAQPDAIDDGRMVQLVRYDGVLGGEERLPQQQRQH